MAIFHSSAGNWQRYSGTNRCILCRQEQEREKLEALRIKAKPRQADTRSYEYPNDL